MSSVRVYKYAVSAPTKNAHVVRSQMRLARAYRNTLIQIERGRRAAIRAAVMCPELSVLEIAAREAQEASLKAWQAVRDARMDARSKKVQEELSEALSSAKTLERSALRILSEYRRTRMAPTFAAISARKPRGRGKNRTDGTWPDDLAPDTLALAERLYEIDVIADGLYKNAREYSGLYWGTYLLVEGEHDAARKTPIWDGLEANDPKFVRWDGSGAVGVQIVSRVDEKTGERIGALYGKGLLTDNDLRLRAVVRTTTLLVSKNGKPLPQRDPNSRRSLDRVALDYWIRVGSLERDPIFARVSARPDRQIPDDARVLGASLMVRHIADKEDWRMLVTVEQPDAITVMPSVGGAVAVDLGWRILKDGVRVGMWCDEHGATGEILLSNRIVSMFRKVEDLRSIRDKNFDMVRNFLAWTLPESLPEWLSIATKSIRLWKSPAKLAALAVTWRSIRWEGDEEYFETIEAWRKQDKHLWTWEEHQRDHMMAARQEVYRLAAVDLSRKYDTLVLEKFDLRRVAMKTKAESAESENDTARGMRVIVAPSWMRETMKKAFAARNRTVAERSAMNTTKACYACGEVNVFDAAEELRHSCTGCGMRWDQDYNAARNLVMGHVRDRSGAVKAAGTGSGSGAGSGAGQRKAKWSKSHSAAATK